MHRDVGEVVVERDLELLDEKALAADLRERPVEHAIALCRHADDLDREARMARAAGVAATCSVCVIASRLSRVAMRMRWGVTVAARRVRAERRTQC